MRSGHDEYLFPKLAALTDAIPHCNFTDEEAKQFKAIVAMEVESAVGKAPRNNSGTAIAGSMVGHGSAPPTLYSGFRRIDGKLYKEVTGE